MRRVKCDEGQPYCTRCIDAGRICIGYHSRSSSSQRLSQQHSPYARKHISLHGIRISTSLIRDAATLHFAENFILVSNEFHPSMGFLDCLETVLVKSSSHFMLQNALNVFACGYYSLFRPSQTISEHRAVLSRYQTAIHATRQSLASQRPSWVLVVTVYLLALFEVCTALATALLYLAIDYR